MGYSAAPLDLFGRILNGPAGAPARLEHAPDLALMDDRRKKLKFRAWRRGFREIDLILGAFADAHVEYLDAAGLDAFEALLGAQDQDVYAWITEAAPAPPEHETPTLASIRAFRFTLPAATTTT